MTMLLEAQLLTRRKNTTATFSFGGAEPLDLFCGLVVRVPG
jgi:hypothetical protein